MEEKAPNLQLQEPVLPESLVPAMDLTWVWITIAAFVVLTAVIILIGKRKKKNRIDPLALRRAAYRTAVKSFESTTADDARDAAVKSSLILRRFLSDAVGDPALFETHEEFITRRDSLEKLTPPAREAATGAFAKLARVKYAPEIPSDDPAVILAEGRLLLDTLNGGFLP
ncbi:hypothetical protein OVA24_13110 [Luteolibacter sp. SL250]|uniref:hypothetical protein n=1 Tax=Luteolibacter sp. SL250 TaxID=2995170 RepID=UPI00226E42D9|nr:hypothetical protein [Luteolibacter sp. SL250]WAC18176.1 hypothetical protein OVA24_13110 [Luteolibacter sp. SL250]